LYVVSEKPGQDRERLSKRLLMSTIPMTRMTAKVKHPNDMQVHFASRVETFKQDSQLDVVWKMYRVRSLALGISAA
jgi:hypothetical protein